jgi:hypothetical protein
MWRAESGEAPLALQRQDVERRSSGARRRLCSIWLKAVVEGRLPSTEYLLNQTLAQKAKISDQVSKLNCSARSPTAADGSLGSVGDLRPTENSGSGLSRLGDLMSNQRIKELKKQIAELKSRWPAHSVPPTMFQQLEDLEEELERELRKAAQGETDAQAHGRDRL